EQAEEGKAYPYGTEIKTGGRSSANVVFSEGNARKLLANTQAAVTGKKKKAKTIELSGGEVEANLPVGYDKTGDSVSIKTPTAICKAIGGKFSVVSKLESSFRLVIIRATEGSLSVSGEYYDIPALEKGDWVSLLSPRDRSFLRLKNMKGKYDVKIVDENFEEKSIPTKVGSVLKIWQRKVAETGEIVVTTMIILQGQAKETVTVTYPAGKAKKGWTGDIPDDGVVKKDVPVLDPEPIVPTPPTTTTTTTTTKPDPTPVGKK
ncbi:FecR domain-containing protein, partial [PVC group bacterium]|nr:FecR domain-containing protein [PVC group bacterium]